MKFLGVVICLAMAAINVPFIVEGSIINIVAGAFAFGAGVFALATIE